MFIIMEEITKVIYSSYTDAQKRATQKYREANKEKVNEQRKKYYEDRKAKDPEFLQYKRDKAKEYYQRKKGIKDDTMLEDIPLEDELPRIDEQLIEEKAPNLEWLNITPVVEPVIKKKLIKAKSDTELVKPNLSLEELQTILIPATKVPKTPRASRAKKVISEVLFSA